MPNGPRLILPNVCYHIITRGNQRQTVFLNEDDFEAYIARIRLYKKRRGFLLYGYCLMPNHIHIVGEPQKPKYLAKFMQGLSRSYTAYFNKKYQKVGHLWQNRYKSKVIAKDAYLIDCIQYVEYNPVKAGLTKAAGEYRWSSYPERALGSNKGKRILNDIIL